MGCLKQAKLKDSENGSVAIIVGIFLVSIIFAIMALSIDMGQNQTEVVDNMGAVEAAANGGATYIQQYQINYAQQNSNNTDWQSKVPTNDALVNYAYKIYKNNVHDQNIGIPVPPDSGDNNAFKACYTAPGASDCMTPGSSSNITHTSTKYASLTLDALNPAAGPGDSEGSFSVKGCMKITPHGVAAASGMATSSIVCSSRKVAIQCHAFTLKTYCPSGILNQTKTWNCSTGKFDTTVVNDCHSDACPTTVEYHADVNYSNGTVNSHSFCATGNGGQNAGACGRSASMVFPYENLGGTNLPPKFAEPLYKALLANDTKVSKSHSVGMGAATINLPTLNIDNDQVQFQLDWTSNNDGNDEIRAGGNFHSEHKDYTVSWSGSHCTSECLHTATGKFDVPVGMLVTDPVRVSTQQKMADDEIDSWQDVTPSVKDDAHKALAQAIIEVSEKNKFGQPYIEYRLNTEDSFTGYNVSTAGDFWIVFKEEYLIAGGKPTGVVTDSMTIGKNICPDGSVK